MKGCRIKSAVFLLPAVLTIFGCAKISAPSGGPRDREPPIITRCVPPVGTTNFSDKEIVITFNEYVVLDKITEKFMASPPLGKRPEISIRGKSVRIRFDEELRDSSTYTFYFQDAIRDLNENNPIDNYQYFFSTGPVIDSLSVTGNLYQAYDLEIPELTMVLLYNQLHDSAVIKVLPDYITRVEKNGEFRIDNVRPGKYRIYALKDLDNSKNYNLPDEEFAFLKDTLDINPTKNYLPVKKDTTVKKDTAVVVNRKKEPTILPPVEGEYKLILFRAENKVRYLTSSDRKLPYHLIYTLSLPPDSLAFDISIPDAGKDSYFIEKSKNNDSITVWLTDSSLYSRQIINTVVNYPFTDTLGFVGTKSDTIMMRYLAPQASRTRRTVVPKRNQYRINSNIKSGSLKPGRQMILTSPTPFRPPDTSRLSLFEVQKDERISIPFNLAKDNLNACRYYLTAELQQGNNYLFVADSAAFGSIYGEYNDSTAIKFSIIPREMLGKLIVNLKNYPGNKIIHLLDNNEKLVKEAYPETDDKLEFPYLDKGLYRLRIIYDINGDRKWTTGDFSTGRQPEPVSYYPGEIEIKVNWEITQDWDIGLQNFKDFKLTNVAKGVKH